MPDIPGLGSVEGLLGSAYNNDTVRSLAIWGILMQLLGALMTPLNQELANLVNPIFPDKPLDPADLADMVERQHIDLATAQAMAGQSGISKDNFDYLVKNVGAPPGLQFLLEAWRRGFIDENGTGALATSLEQGILESRLMDKWVPLIKQMGVQPISAADAVNAWVRNQVDPATAQKILYQNGYDAANATILFNTTGNPPGPTELLTLYRRGFIPMHGTGPLALSVDQGIAEGSSKDKWIAPLEQLAVYLPPPRTITALERSGVISPAQAQQLYAQQGLSPQLAQAYSADASGLKVAAAKQLAESTVLTLYESAVIDEAQTDTLLLDLGYNAQEAHYIESTIELKKELSLLQSAISKVGSLFVARKIDKAAATQALTDLGLPADSISYHLQLWGLEQTNTTRLLTAAEIADALNYGVMDQATAQQELENLGYTPFDAWVLLSVRMHGPQGTAPALGPSPSGNIT